MGFNSGFKGLTKSEMRTRRVGLHLQVRAVFHQQLSNLSRSVHDCAHLLKIEVNQRNAVPLQHLAMQQVSETLPKTKHQVEVDQPVTQL